MSSCSNNNVISRKFTDNTGKCFNYDQGKYADSRTFLVFNKNDDVIVIRSNLSFFGPMENMTVLFGKEVSCPNNIDDYKGYDIENLKKYGVYNDVTKHININITD